MCPASPSLQQPWHVRAGPSILRGRGKIDHRQRARSRRERCLHLRIPVFVETGFTDSSAPWRRHLRLALGLRQPPVRADSRRAAFYYNTAYSLRRLLDYGGGSGPARLVRRAARFDLVPAVDVSRSRRWKCAPGMVLGRGSDRHQSLGPVRLARRQPGRGLRLRRRRPRTLPGRVVEHVTEDGRRADRSPHAERSLRSPRAESVRNTSASASSIFD